MHDDTASTSFRDAVVSSIAGLCAGALLAMAAATMLPAAYERAGRQSVPLLSCPILTLPPLTLAVACPPPPHPAPFFVIDTQFTQISIADVRGCTCTYGGGGDVGSRSWGCWHHAVSLHSWLWRRQLGRRPAGETKRAREESREESRGGTVRACVVFGICVGFAPLDSAGGGGGEQANRSRLESFLELH